MCTYNKILKHNKKKRYKMALFEEDLKKAITSSKEFVVYQEQRRRNYDVVILFAF